MVGISGIRDRHIELVKKDDYEVVVFGGWPNWERYFDKYVNMKIEDKDESIVELRPEFQWQWKQNYPELVVDDVVGFMYYWGGREFGDFLYGDSLYRGVNKWLFVRYLLIRYKKLVADWRDSAWGRYERWKRLYDIANPRKFEMSANEWGKLNYMKGYWKGYYDAMRTVRADLKTMATTPRYVVWNGSRPGFVVDKKISRGWLELVKKLYDVRFEK